MLVAIYNNNIVGSTSLTFKQAIIKDKQIKISILVFKTDFKWLKQIQKLNI